MAATTYRKTPAGVAEIRERRSGLDAKARTLLILCNGLMTEQALAEQMKQPVAGLLVHLCEQGFLEPVGGSRSAPASLRAQPVAPAAPVAAPAPPPTVAPDRHQAMIQRAWRVLEPLFGPGTEERLRPVEQAGSPAQLRKALDDVRDAIAIYRGRKNAAELMARIEQG